MERTHDTFLSCMRAASHCMASHCMAWRCMAWRCMASHCMAWPLVCTHPVWHAPGVLMPCSVMPCSVMPCSAHDPALFCPVHDPFVQGSLRRGGAITPASRRSSHCATTCASSVHRDPPHTRVPRPGHHPARRALSSPRRVPASPHLRVTLLLKAISGRPPSGLPCLPCLPYLPCLPCLHEATLPQAPNSQIEHQLTQGTPSHMKGSCPLFRVLSTDRQSFAGHGTVLDT